MRAGEKPTFKIDTPVTYIDYLKKSGYKPSSIESFIRRFEHEQKLKEQLSKLPNPYLFSSPDDRYGQISSYK